MSHGLRSPQLRKRKMPGWHKIRAFHRKNTCLGPCLQKKCGLVTGQNSLDAELGGCGMLMGNLPPRIDRSVYEQRTPIIAVDVSLLYKVQLSVECLARGWTLTELPPTPSCGAPTGRKCLGLLERYVPPLRAMDEILHGTIWRMISPLLNN